MYARCVSIVSLVMMQWNMLNCVDIIFSQADMKRLHSLFPACNCYRCINHYVLGVSFISRCYFVLFWCKWPKGRSSHLQPRTILPKWLNLVSRYRSCGGVEQLHCLQNYYKALWNRYSAERKSCGQPRKTSDRFHRRMKITSMWDHFKTTSKVLAETCYWRFLISAPHAARRRLKEPRIGRFCSSKEIAN